MGEPMGPMYIAAKVGELEGFERGNVRAQTRPKLAGGSNQEGARAFYWY